MASFTKPDDILNICDIISEYQYSTNTVLNFKEAL